MQNQGPTFQERIEQSGYTTIERLLNFNPAIIKVSKTKNTLKLNFLGHKLYIHNYLSVNKPTNCLLLFSNVCMYIQATMFKCDISVEKIDTSRGWFYYSCNICNERLNESADGYSCYDHGSRTPKFV